MKDQDFASDEECLNIRNSLIEKGIIVPGKSNLIKKNGVLPTVSTKKYSKNLREDLINREFIFPVELQEDGSISYCKLIPYRGKYFPKEEGEYKSKPIKNNRDYIRRKQIYFRMIQEILYSRRELKLVLGKKEDSDPDWYF